MKISTLFILCLIPFFVFAQSRENDNFLSLFSDYKACTVGDGVTIIVVESSQAQNQSQTSTGRDSDLGLNFSGSLDGSDVIPGGDFGINSSNKFKGGGATQTSGMVKTKISALIDSVLSNGLIRINGSRKIVVNGEEQMIRIKGLVRTTDINPDNTVFSYNISEAEIIFEGSGMIEQSTNQGWLTKFFHWLF